jgi:predicted enzyme related to lactoylglutathione lyase
MRMVTIDCDDPRKIAPFWAEATGYSEVFAYENEFVILAPADGGTAPALGLQRVPDPTPGKNRVHIDFHTQDREAEVARLVKLGATRGEQHQVPGQTWVVMTDPVGNQFCVA